MSARCVVVCCAVLATALLGTTRYAVQAFPLLRPVDTANQDALGPGPVERRAKPITPENPVPRRTYYVPPDLPSEAEAIGARGMVMVRITLDETGQIAETRIVGLSVNLGDRGSVSTSNPAGVNLEAALNSQVRLSPETSSQSLRPALQTTIEAVLRAVRQWQYAPPADGPIAFSVTVPVGSTAAIPPPPPPPPPSDSSSWEGAQGALRVGGTIQPPAKIRNVAPIYPPDAMAARVQGVVILEVRVEADGRVGQARILRSIPLLDDAALDAVRQWEFTPTLINGQAVPVLMTTTINFTMQ